jgi:hypothetical protein
MSYIETLGSRQDGGNCRAIWRFADSMGAGDLAVSLRKIKLDRGCGINCFSDVV